MKTPRKPVNRSPEASPPPPPPPPPPWDAYARLCRGWASMLLERQQQGTDKYEPPKLWVLDAPDQRIPTGCVRATLADEGVITVKAGTWTAQEACLACSPTMMMALAPTGPWKPSEAFLQMAVKVAPEYAAKLRKRLGVARPEDGAVIRARWAGWWDQFGWLWGRGQIIDGPALQYTDCVGHTDELGRADCLGGGDVILAAQPVGLSAGFDADWPRLTVDNLSRLDYPSPGAPVMLPLAVQRERAAALLQHVARKLLPLLPSGWVKPEWLHLEDFLIPWTAAIQSKMDAWVAAERKRLAGLEGGQP